MFTTFSAESERPVLSGWRLSLTALCAAVVVLGLVIDRTLPLDDHEAFVVQTAQEMHARGDFLVPYFNNQPRLSKPPMSYWLTCVVAYLSGNPDRYEAWFGRLPSVLAGLGAALLIVWIGSALYSRATGLIAALVYVTSCGFFAYLADARPEMVYSFYCLAGFCCFVAAIRRFDAGAGYRHFVFAGWLALALASLTKGPHVPAAFMLALWAYLTLERRGWRVMVRVLRPVAGAMILVGICLPWWAGVHHELGGEGVWGTQIGGTLYSSGRQEPISPYYAYRPLQMFFPWIVFAPLAIAYGMNALRSDRRIVLLLLPYLSTALLLTFGPQYRWFYMWPAVPMMFVILAASIVERQHVPVALKTGSLLLYQLTLIGVGIWLLSQTDDVIVNWSVTGVVGYLIWRLFRNAIKAIEPPRLADVAVTAALTYLLLLAVAWTQIGWSHGRFERARFGRQITAAVGRDEPLFAWGVNPGVFVYYGNHPIEALAGPPELLQRTQATTSTVLLLPERRLGVLDHRLNITQLDHLNAAGQQDRVFLIRARSAGNRHEGTARPSVRVATMLE